MRIRSILQKPSLLMLLVALSGWQNAALAGDVFYSGRATGVTGTLTVSSVTKKILLSRNDMSCQGLAKEETISAIDNPTPLGVKAKTITTYTLGRDGVALAQAAVEDLVLDFPGLKLSASLVDAYSEVRCENGIPIPTGNSNILNVVINGQARSLTAAPNQTITIPNVATIIFNEQVKWKREFKANAIHIKLFNPDTPANGNIIISETKAKISSCEAVCTP